MNKLSTISVAAALCAAAWTADAANEYIAFGWEFAGVTPEMLLAQADELDKTPLDGIGVTLTAWTKDKRKVSTRTIMSDPPWPQDVFDRQIPIFRKATAHRSLRACFAKSFCAPRKRIDWTDDEAWGRIAHNMAIVARAARESGFRGLSMDPEDYHKAKQFTRRAEEVPYHELCGIARRRGRELFSRVFAEFPDAVVYGYWLFSMVPHYAHHTGADVAGLVRDAEALWPAFLNGILDALPPGARMVDGDENSYRYSADAGGYRAAAFFNSQMVLPLVAPENREKFRTQVSTGFAMYLDMFISDENAKWYKGPEDGSRAERFRRDMAQADETSGGYVWFWGEKRVWTAWKGRDFGDARMKNVPWKECIPGLEVAIWSVKDPAAAFDRLTAEPACPPATNLVAAGAEYTVTNGWEVAKVGNVRGGEWFAVSLEAEGTSASVNVSYRDAAGKYVKPSAYRFAMKPQAGDVSRRVGKGVFRTPQGTVSVSVVMCANNRPGEKTVFRNLKLYRIVDSW